MKSATPLTLSAIVLLAWSASGLAQSVEPQGAPGSAPETLSLPKAPASADAGDLEAYLDGVIAAHARDHNIPGITLAVVRDDRPDLVKGYGVADVASGRPVDPGATLFRIGSISKTFIWTAAMMLVERGQLDLDADVNDYLDSFRIRDAFDAPVTMNHLMAHRAGFEDSLRVFTVADDDPRSLAEVLAEHQPARVYPPGARTSYSNWGAALAAHIVEQVAGIPYSEFVRREIFDPLGMASTTLAGPDRMPADLRGRLATGHAFRGGSHEAGEFMQLGAYAPAGAIASTATDMARWMRFHLNRGELDGVRLMRPATHQRMWSRAFADRPGGADLVHGFRHSRHRGFETIGHAGGTAHFISNMVLVPELHVGLFVSQNSQHGGRSLLVQWPELLIDRLTGQFPGGRGGEREANRQTPRNRTLEDYAGGYINNRRVFSALPALFAARNTLEVDVADDNEALVVTTGGETLRYRAVPGFADTFENRFGRRLVFQRDGNGEVVAVVGGFGTHSYERPEPLDAPGLLYASTAVSGLLAVTILLGAWRRWRQAPETTTAGRPAARIAVLAAIVVLAFLVLTVVVLASISASTGADLLIDYPPTGIVVLSLSGWVVATAALLMLAALVPVWRGSNWGIWRRLHYSLFALALAVFAFELWNWRLFGAPLI